MPEQRNLEEIGLESFALGQVPDSATITDASAAILEADPDRAYMKMTLLSITAGSAFYAVGQDALDLKGSIFTLGAEETIMGGERIEAICGDAAATAIVAFQAFKRGLPNQGTAV